MSRRNPASNTGYINWPIYLKNTGEGGMFVYAVVPALESFQMCCGVASCCLVMGEVLVEEEKEFFPHASLEEFRFENFLSVPLLAAVCLGSSGGSFWDGEEYWHCTMSDLTDAGSQLVGMLRELYGVEPELLTFLDT